MCFFFLCASLELCPECREGLLCQQQRDLREYTQATIYIHKVVDNKKVRAPHFAPHPPLLFIHRTLPSAHTTLWMWQQDACRSPAGLAPAGEGCWEDWDGGGGGQGCHSRPELALWPK